MPRPPLPLLADDPFKLAQTARNEPETQRLLKQAQGKTLNGLWRINGVAEFDASASDFFLGSVLGLALLAARCELIDIDAAIAKAESEVTEAEMVQARRMCHAYDFAMTDAAKTIANQARQLELF